MQKRSEEVLCRKQCSQKFCKLHWKSKLTLLVVFYKKTLFKNFAIFTGRMWLVISVLWKRCSWWLKELWKWRVFILINISYKKVQLAKWAALSLRIIEGIFFGPDFFWLKHSHNKRKDSLETRASCSWILILTWSFGGSRSDSASTFFKIASVGWFWCC